MTENLEIECKECNAVFNIKHNLNIARYEIGFCVFCGAELSEEYKDEVEPPEWDDDE